ncbi:MAG: DNA polymerase ligase N-terminal domain-containing protein [Candidatus Bathyarchaeota archaeon]
MEPEREETTMNKEKICVVQEHHAAHLHWDLRLEMNGLLKSWAIPKEPPREVGIKRLAIPVEDHPIDYASFSGTLPEGQYGAGEVIIWDKGTYKIISIQENKMVIIIYGEKLQGEYCLIKTKFQGKENWLLFKTKNLNK